MKQMEIEAKHIFRKIYKILIKLSSSSNIKQKRKKIRDARAQGRDSNTEEVKHESNTERKGNQIYNFPDVYRYCQHESWFVEVVHNCTASRNNSNTIWTISWHRKGGKSYLKKLDQDNFVIKG